MFFWKVSKSLHWKNYNVKRKGQYISIEKRGHSLRRVLFPFLVQSYFFTTSVYLAESVGKKSACNAVDTGSIPGSGGSTGEEIGYPLQYSLACLVAQLVKNSPEMWETWVGKIPGGGKGHPPQYSGLENSLDCYRPWGHKELDTTEQLSLSGNFTSLKVMLCADVPNIPVFSMWSGNKFSCLFQKWI